MFNISRDEDFQYILQGITRLLMNPLQQTYLPYAHRKVSDLNFLIHIIYLQRCTLISNYHREEM